MHYISAKPITELNLSFQLPTETNMKY